MLVEFELKKLGLSDKEIKVYLALLELGEAAVQKISQKSKVNRATTYVILEGLAKKSLVSEIEKEGKTLYGAQDPEFFFNLAPQKPRVRFFEGKEGLKAIQEDILKEKNAEINEFYSSDDIHRIFDKEELNKFAQKRAAQKIKAKAFYTRAAGPLESIKFTELNEIKYLSQKQYPLHVDIIIYGDKIGLILGEFIQFFLV